MSKFNLKKLQKYEKYLKNLKLEKWWIRAIDSVYRVITALIVLFFIFIYIVEDMYDPGFSGTSYYLLVTTTILSGFLIAYRIFIWFILYIIYGNSKIEQVEINSLDNKSIIITLSIFMYFIIMATTWIVAGP